MSESNEGWIFRNKREMDYQGGIVGLVAQFAT